MRWFVVFGISILTIPPLQAEQIWTVRVEEPTGLYRRTGEIVEVPLGKVGSSQKGFRVADPEGRELPWQVAEGKLLFPASLIPGELPEYRISCCGGEQVPRFSNIIVLRRIGMRRVELGNTRFRAVIDIAAPAIIEMYSLAAGPQRMLNIVETTPENPEALKGDIQEGSTESTTAIPAPVPGVPGENDGWTSLGGRGPMSGIDFMENGPLRGRLRLSRPGESWEFVWTANGAWLRWKAHKGFRFASVSASPYLPFDRCLGGSEYAGPSGPGDEEPADHQIDVRSWKKLPGGHVVYYRNGDNYGALGIVALDPELNWVGVGSRRFLGEKAEGDAEIALTFPTWRGKETVMEARKENRELRQPLLVEVSRPSEGGLNLNQPASREAEPEIRQNAATAFQAQTLSLEGTWELAWVEKGKGPPVAGWRPVQVPGSVHTQWLEASKIYTREAEWISTKEWWYRRSFCLPGQFRGKHLRLQFEATDYYADAYLNGTQLGRHEGYIDPYEYDVTPYVRIGDENQLMVRVWTPVSYYWRHRPYTVKGSYGAVDQ